MSFARAMPRIDGCRKQQTNKCLKCTVQQCGSRACPALEPSIPDIGTANIVEVRAAAERWISEAREAFSRTADPSLAVAGFLRGVGFFMPARRNPSIAGNKFIRGHTRSGGTSVATLGRMYSHPKFLRFWSWAALALCSVTFASAPQNSGAGNPPAVAVPLALAQANAGREGAGEFLVLMESVRAGAQPGSAGPVGVGNRPGLFSLDSEEALKAAVLQEIPVVKLATRGQVLPAPHGLFIDGGNLSEEEACRVLAQCLSEYVGLPAAGGAAPSPREVAAIQQRLRRYQRQFTVASGARLAAR